MKSFWATFIDIWRISGRTGLAFFICCQLLLVIEKKKINKQESWLNFLSHYLSNYRKNNDYANVTIMTKNMMTTLPCHQKVKLVMTKLSQKLVNAAFDATVCGSWLHSQREIEKFLSVC